MEESAYVATNYTAPRVLSVVSKFLSVTRFAGSRNFADLVSPNYNDQKDYTHGFITFVSVMAAFLFLWAAVLIVLKYKGERVGCASGRPFQATKEQAVGQSSSTTVNDMDSSIVSTSDEELVDEQRSTNESKGTSEFKINAIRRRQRRTRFAFFASGLVVLVCAALLLVFSFSPIRQSTNSLGELFDASQDLIDQVKTSVRTVESASNHVNETFFSISWDFNTICPNFDNAASLGVDLQELTGVLGTEFNRLETEVTRNTTIINQTLSLLHDTLDKMEGATEKTYENLWILPAVILFVFVVTTAILVAAILTWTEKSRISFEKRIAFGVLPFLVIAAVVCWIIAACAAISTLISSDACTGNPDATVQAILQEHNVDMSSTTFEFITFFTNGCRGQDPTVELSKLEEELQTSIDSIWRHISIADSIGHDELALRCGKSVEDILDAARNLALSLAWTRKALISAIESLQCAPINAIYIQAVHGSFCTDSAQALAWAYVLFSLAAIGGMSMVSTRACLYNPVCEEEVYDESEVAENMILNEHEEYLAYISKYKHEWEEYQGINTVSLENSLGSDDNSIRSAEGDSERGEDEMLLDAEETWSAGSSELFESESDHDYESVDSTPSEDISFLSLRASPTSETDQQVDPLAIPSMLGGPPEDQEPVFFPIVFPLSMGDHNEEGDPNVEVQLPTSVPFQASRNDECTPRASNTHINTMRREDTLMDEDDIQLPTSVPSQASRNNECTPRASNTHINTMTREDTLMDEDDVHKSLYYIQSPVVEHADEPDWCPSFRETETKSEEIEVSLLKSTARASNIKLGFSLRPKKVTKTTAPTASPEVLDRLNYYSRNELPSPTVSRNIAKASPKLKLIVDKFEI